MRCKWRNIYRCDGEIFYALRKKMTVSPKEALSCTLPEFSKHLILTRVVFSNSM